MEQLDRFKKAIEYLKSKAEKPTNDAVSKLLRYKTLSYISDVMGGSKPITDLLLDRMVENSINKNWIETGNGEMLLKIPKISEDMAAYNTALPMGDLKVTLRDYVELLKEKAAKAEEREREYLDIIKKKLISIDASSKEMAEDISALTTEIQAEHRAMMDSIDVAAGQPIGTTFSKSDSVEIASEKERVGRGKKDGARKPHKQARLD